MMSLLALEMSGISVGFVQTKMAAIILAKTSEYILAH